MSGSSESKLFYGPYNPEIGALIEAESNRRVGSLWERQDRTLAIQHILRGSPVGVFNFGVAAIWGDGGSGAFVDAIQEIKTGREKSPLAATLPAEQLLPLIDQEKIPSLYRVTGEVPFLTDTEKYRAYMGFTSFARIPLLPEAAQLLPPSMVSFDVNGTPVLQNWIPDGHRPVTHFLREMKSAGIKYPAVTSMNVHGMASIVSQREMALFQSHNIPFVLVDPYGKMNGTGSYWIVDFCRDPAVAVRAGNLPRNVFNKLFPHVVIDESTKSEQHIPLEFPQNLLNLVLRSSEVTARAAVILYMNGNSAEQIIEWLGET